VSDHTIVVIWVIKTFFVQFFCICCHLLISSASVRSKLFLSFIVSIFAWNVPLVSLIFLKRSLVFPSLLIPSISLHCSLKKAFVSLLAILWNSAFRWVYLSFSPLPFTSHLFSAICKTTVHCLRSQPGCEFSLAKPQQRKWIVGWLQNWEMGWQVHRESKWWVVDENIAEIIASWSQARKGREVNPGGSDTQSVPTQTNCGWICEGLKGMKHKAPGKTSRGQRKLGQLALPRPVWLSNPRSLISSRKQGSRNPTQSPVAMPYPPHQRLPDIRASETLASQAQLRPSSWISPVSSFIMTRGISQYQKHGWRIKAQENKTQKSLDLKDYNQELKTIWTLISLDSFSPLLCKLSSFSLIKET